MKKIVMHRTTFGISVLSILLLAWIGWDVPASTDSHHKKY